MPAVTPSHGAAATASSTAKKKPTTLAGALNKLHWDTALALVMSSDPYYHYTPAHERISHTTAVEGNADVPREHWFRRYALSSSKTRLLVHVGAVGYLGYVLTHPSRYVACRVTVSSTTSADAAAAVTDCYIYQGAEGMQLLMRGAMPKWAVLLHAIAGSLLLPLAITQKESVFYMPFARKPLTAAEAEAEKAEAQAHRSASATAATAEAAQAQSDAKKVHLRRARVSRRHHGNCGFLTGVCVVVMVAGGVSLRSYSVFAAPATSARAGILNFASAMFLFAAPWAVLTPATAASGGQGKAAAHAMLGGVLIKAILAVPFERVLGGVWQKLAGVHVALPPAPRWFGGDDTTTRAAPVEITQRVEAELERVYYKSILVTTVVFGLWGVADIVRFVRLAKKCVVAEESAKKSA